MSTRHIFGDFEEEVVSGDQCVVIGWLYTLESCPFPLSF